MLDWIYRNSELHLQKQDEAGVLLLPEYQCNM